jgi:single-strand DNA-binding protein
MSLNESVISMAGWVAGEVRSGTHDDSNRPWAAFRFVWTPRRYDRAKGTYVDAGGGNFVTVWCYWELAQHVTSCLKKGDPVLVIGRLRIEEKEFGGKTYGEAGITANAVGHNLAWGTSAFRRTRAARAPATAPSDGGTVVRPSSRRWDEAPESETQDGQAA